MPVEHRWPPDETPWPEGASLAYGEMVELVTPDPPVPELGRLGPGIVGTRGVVVECVLGGGGPDSRSGPVYSVEAEDGSPWALGPEFLRSRGELHPAMPPRSRSDLPEGTRVRIRPYAGLPAGTAEAVGEVTGLWWTTSLEPPKGYTVQVGDSSFHVTPQQTEVL
ncbi:hypothetical protein GCM10018781_46570 [Kitasatospora indigofera]|uniref:Uncharacterized protein n=1 Tax=Kitasatospora indigofera TaxID=67307 RepID=A0A919G132_9ACTN|nr:hypothetical protein [Kitasatospora indigofera]GHH76115.1 hypothetical protein GCM10018781_46570 [Kitasatospora indigofera]